MIGYDLVPITTAETSHLGLVPGSARNLAAARYARVVLAPISVAAGNEYRGWTQMLAGTGFDGPLVEPVLLPAEVPEADLEQTARLLDGCSSAPCRWSSSSGATSPARPI